VLSVVQLADEWRVLDMCASTLVKQLAPRCVEWSSVLELMRTRLEQLWLGTGGAMLQRERARAEDEPAVRPHGEAAAGGADGAAAVAALSEQLTSALARASAAEARAAVAEAEAREAEMLRAQVATQQAELVACRALADEQTALCAVRTAELHALSATTRELQAARDAAAHEHDGGGAARPVLVLHPEDWPPPSPPARAAPSSRSSSPSAARLHHRPPLSRRRPAETAPAAAPAAEAASPAAEADETPTDAVAVRLVRVRIGVRPVGEAAQEPPALVAVTLRSVG
jgi:hypothetical protein